MSELTPEDVDKIKAGVVRAIHAHWKLYLMQGIAMIVLGVIAVSAPLVSTLAAEIIVGWLFIAGGSVRILSLPRSTATPGFWWSLLTAIVVAALGVMLIAQPAQGVLTLTMMLIVLFILEGVVSILWAFELRQHMQSWVWVLINGIIDLWLALLIWSGWPGSATWAIGLLVGVNLLFFGASLAMTAFAARDLKPR